MLGQVSRSLGFNSIKVTGMVQASERYRASYWILLMTLWLTLLVLGVKVWTGLTTHSLSILSESLHTLIDLFSTLLSLLAVALPYRFTGRELWAHSKRETVLSLGIVAVFGFVGISLLILSLQQLAAFVSQTPPLVPIHIDLLSIQLLGVVAALNLCLTLYERYEARLLDSYAMLVNAHHAIQDAWLTVLMLAGLVGCWQGWLWLDPFIATLLVLMAGKSLWSVFNRQLPFLVQQMAIAPEALAQLACYVEGVAHCYRIRSRGMVGRQVFIEMHLVIYPEFTNTTRLIVERIEGLLKQHYGRVQSRIFVEVKSKH